MKKIALISLLSFFISIPVILPFFHAGYFPTHDGEWAVVRLGDMFRTLRDFQFPPRYSGALNFGYGYPLFNFTYPIPYYLGTFIHFLGFGFVDTIKILFAGSVPLSAFFMFLASRVLWKNTWAGVVSSIFFVYFPYRMVDLYVRGSIGESLSFILFPLLFYLAIKLIEKPSYFWFIGIAISLAVIVTTHNIMTVLFLPVWILFIVSKVIFDKKKDSLKQIIFSILLGIGLSAFFWVPALFEKHLILLSQTPIADRNLYFVALDQFLFPRWGYGVPTDANGFSYQIGLPHLATFVTIISVLSHFLYKSVFKKNMSLRGSPAELGRRSNPLNSEIASLVSFARNDKKITALVLIIIWLIYFFLLFSPSAIIWKTIPFLKEINYPWTALGVLGFLSSLLAGFLCGQKITRYIAVAFSLVAAVLILPYAKPQYYVDRGDNFYLTNDATTTSSNELMPLWVKKMPDKRPREKIEVFGQGKVENISYNSKQISFSVDLFSQSTVRINTIYYPGWKVYVDNQNIEVSYDNEHGVMDISSSPGKHLVKANFTETLLRTTSNTISLLSFVAVLFLGIKVFRKSFSV